MSNKTGRRRRTIPGYVSIEIASFRSIAASFKNDAEFGRWVKKAFDDMSIGCVLDDTDPRIRAIYTEAFDRMEYEYKRKKEWEERKNKEIAENPEQLENSRATPQLARPGTKPFGKFGNVYITDDEYAELGLAVGNQNDLNTIIDALGASLEDGSRTSTNHYATLTKWVQYRKDKDKEKEERQNANNETFVEREGRRQIEQLRKCGLLK